MDIETALQKSDPARQVEVPAADSPLGTFIRRQMAPPLIRRSTLRFGVISAGVLGAGGLLIIGTLAVILIDRNKFAPGPQTNSASCDCRTIVEACQRSQSIVLAGTSDERLPVRADSHLSDNIDLLCRRFPSVWGEI